MSRPKSYRDLNELLYQRTRERNPIPKHELARLLSEKAGRKVWPSQVTALLNPDKYRVSLDEPLVDAIAELLNQTPDYVARYYAKAA